MSDLLTHWAVFDDCRRLVVFDDAVAPEFQRLMHEQREIARLGAITRGGGWWVPHILRSARDGRSGDDLDDPVSRRVAFALGGLAHAACDRLLKPLLSRRAETSWNAAHHALQAGTADETQQRVQEVSAYYDAHVFRRVYLDGAEEPLNRFLLAANDTRPGETLETFIRALFQRALLSCHTLKPDREHVDDWLDNLFDLIQPLYVDIKVFVEVYQNPDPEKMQRYAVESEFYRDDDPVVQAARAVQRGAVDDQGWLESAIRSEDNKSHYGQALHEALVNLREATDFWYGRADTLEVIG